MTVSWRLVWLIPLVGLVLGAIPGRSPKPVLPDVVVISIDTLRADRCSLYGSPRTTTPFLQELAKRAVVFETAYPTSSWTPPSMASLFTGLPPRAHGVVKGTIRDGKAFNQELLDNGFTTFAEAFLAAGYQTVGISSNAHLAKRTGFAQGFETFRELPWQDASAIGIAARELVAARKPGKPLLLWLHYFDPHNPYRAHERWIGAASSDRVEVDAQLLERFAGADQRDLLQAARESTDRVRMKEALFALYDSEIAYVDSELRTLFRDLPIKPDALVAITSDHGESIMDHGWIGHGRSLYEAETRVPLLIRPPGGTTESRVSRPVSNLDLFATLVEQAGIPRPPQLKRPSLLTVPATPQPVMLELNRDTLDHAAVRAGRYKLYRRFAPRQTIELFDIEADPREQRNLAASDPATRARLGDLWTQWTEAWPRFTAAQKVTDPQDPELIERLRSLGYVDGGEEQ